MTCNHSNYWPLAVSGPPGDMRTVFECECGKQWATPRGYEDHDECCSEECDLPLVDHDECCQTSCAEEVAESERAAGHREVGKL